MIKSKNDFVYYVNSDLIARNFKLKRFRFFVKELIFPNSIVYFQYLLRRIEYYYNCKEGVINKIIYFYYLYRFNKVSIRLGFSIPKNVFGPGLVIVHYGTIVINSEARIGKNCRIHACTNVGASGGESKAPIIGDNVYIGPGVKIFGNIKIGNNIVIGANSVVNKSFTEENILIAGCPAKKIKKIEVKEIIKHIDC